MSKALDIATEAVLEEAMKANVHATWQRLLAVDGNMRQARRRNAMRLSVRDRMQRSVNRYVEWLQTSGWLDRFAADALQVRKKAKVQEAVWTDRMSRLGLYVSAGLWENFHLDSGNAVFTNPQHVASFNIGTYAQTARETIGVMGVKTNWKLRLPPEIAHEMLDVARIRARLSDVSILDAVDKILYKEFYVEGKNPREIHQILKDKVPGITNREAHNLAHQETLNYSMLGAMTSFRALGVEYVRWMSHHYKNPEDPRPSHLQADGQTVKLEDGFYVGADILRYPGDPLGSYRETMNCHCTMVPIVDERVQKYAGELDEYFKDIDPELRRGGQFELVRYREGIMGDRYLKQAYDAMVADIEKTKAALEAKGAARPTQVPGAPVRPWDMSDSERYLYAGDMTHLQKEHRLVLGEGGISITNRYEDADGNTWYLKSGKFPVGHHYDVTFAEVVSSELGPRLGVRTSLVRAIDNPADMPPTFTRGLHAYDWDGQKWPANKIARTHGIIVVEDWNDVLKRENGFYPRLEFGARPPVKSIDIEEHVRATLFDYVMNSQDRHSRNRFYWMNSPDGVSHLFLFDFGMSGPMARGMDYAEETLYAYLRSYKYRAGVGEPFRDFLAHGSRNASGVIEISPGREARLRHIIDSVKDDIRGLGGEWRGLLSDARPLLAIDSQGNASDVISHWEQMLEYRLRYILDTPTTDLINNLVSGVDKYY